MILLLGASGYIGQAFARALRSRADCFIPLSRGALDYTRFEYLFDYLRKVRPDFVINAAGFCERANADLIELDRFEMLQANVVLPQVVARACAMTNTPWGHISSGSIYSGARVARNGTLKIELDLSRDWLQQLFLAHPESFHGFREEDEPNCSFKFSPCSFHSGTKALAEEAIREQRQCYIWRLRLPFSHQEAPGNFLTQMSNGAELGDGLNSLSQLDDCVNACLELWERDAPFGIYNVTNPGAISTRELVEKFQRLRKPRGHNPSLSNTARQAGLSGRASCAGCILDVTKLLRTGIKIRTLGDALDNVFRNWGQQSSLHPSTSSELSPARMA